MPNQNEASKPSDKSMLTQAMDKMKQMEEQISLLTRVADKGRMARLENPTKQAIKVKISLYQGQVVIEWRLLTNLVKYTKNGQVEDQTVQYLVSDGKETSTVEMSYLTSVYDTQKETVEVKKIITEDGENTYTVEYEGQEYNISSKYVN